MSLQSFSRTAIASFPPEFRVAAGEAGRILAPFIDATYRQPFVDAQVQEHSVSLPTRIHFLSYPDLPKELSHREWLAARCLMSRSTDGFRRQEALKDFIASSEPAVIPFVALLAGEYVVEILQDIVSAMPALDQTAYAHFVLENGQLMKWLQARATSYWNCYYRHRFPERTLFSGLVFLEEIGEWARKQSAH